MNESLDQALKFHKNGNLDKAEKIYLNILKKNSTNASLLQLLGTLNLQKKNRNDVLATSRSMFGEFC